MPFALILMPATAGAKLKPIRGKLDGRGYTVIAVAANGKASTDRAPRGKFSVRPRAASVSLQLRSPDGTYGGPIVIATRRHGDRAVVGVAAGADLGQIDVRAAKGYAKVKKPPEDAIVDNLLARAKNGVPIGAGKFGLVRSKPPRKPPKGDRDLDGVPDPLDIDDDGDRIVDNVDPASPSANSARTSQVGPGSGVGAFSGLGLGLTETLNANVAGSEQRIDEVLARLLQLNIGSIGIQADSGTLPELDCGNPNTGLVYCRRNNSTGQKTRPFSTLREPFPSCCDADADGFGTLEPVTGGFAEGKVVYGVQLRPGAGSDQVGTGDVLVEHFMINGVETAFVGAVQYVFDTVPALVSYDDGAGNSTTLAYPVSPGDPGTLRTGFPVADGPDADSDVQVTLRFWRPQREPIAGEPGSWIDIGHAVYSVNVEASPGLCPQSAYSESDPNLTPSTDTTGPLRGLVDSADDRPADPANTLTFTVDLTQCFAASGLAFNPGDDRQIALTVKPNVFTFGPPAANQAAMLLSFKHQ